MRLLSYSAPAVLLIAVLTACGTPATTPASNAAVQPMADGEKTVDLLAGRDTVAGALTMARDGTTFRVTYDTSTTGWCIVSTHLHVAQEPDDIPQNRGGLIPGRFDYSDSHACVSTVAYDIDLSGFDPGTLYVAAHAEVADTTDEQTIELTSSVGDTVYGPVYDDPFSTSVDWTDYGPKSAVQAENDLVDNGFDGPFWGDEDDGIITQFDIPGATWISTAARTEAWEVGSWRYFTKPFDVPGHPVSGEVEVNADNAYWLYVNGATQADWADFLWDNDLKTHAFSPTEGENLLAFIAMNYEVPELPQFRNPNGLVYKAIIRYYPTEAAWADGVSPGRNRSMYTDF